MSMSPQWFQLAITAAVVLGGMAVNLFIIGRLVGKSEAAMKSVADTLTKVEKRADDAADQAEVNKGAIALIDARLATAEAAVSKFWEMRDEFVALRTAVEMEGKYQREKMDAIGRSQGVVERQLANLVTSKAGFTTLSSENKN